MADPRSGFVGFMPPDPFRRASAPRTDKAPEWGGAVADVDRTPGA